MKKVVFVFLRWVIFNNLTVSNYHSIVFIYIKVAVYKLLARSECIPNDLAATAMPSKPKATSLLPEPYEISNELEDGDKLPYDLMKVIFSIVYRFNNLYYLFLQLELV